MEWMDRVLTVGRDGSDDLAKLELVKDGGLTSSIETNYEDPYLLLHKQATEQLPK